MQLLSLSNKIYSNKAQAYDDYRAVMWNSREEQVERFFQIYKNIEIYSADILDVGCGNGGLCAYLDTLHYPFRYTGWDVNDDLLEQARKQTGRQYFNVDIMKTVTHPFYFTPTFDYVVMSGVLNLNAGQDFEWCCEFIRRMFCLCKKGIVFNALSMPKEMQEKEMFYLDPAHVMGFCLTLSPKVMLKHYDLEYNFTVKVER